MNAREYHAIQCAKLGLDPEKVELIKVDRTRDGVYFVSVVFEPVAADSYEDAIAKTGAS